MIEPLGLEAAGLGSDWGSLLWLGGFTSEDLCHSSTGGRIKTLPVKSHRVWSLSLILFSSRLSRLSSAQPGHLGLCQDGSGAELSRGSGEVTLEAALCPRISPWGPTKRQECGPELAEGHLEGWPGLCLAPHKCPGGMGSVGEFPLCQQQPRLRAGGMPPLWLLRSL